LFVWVVEACMSQGVIATARQRICGTGEAEEETQDKSHRRQQRNAAVGILATDDDIRAYFSNEETTCFHLPVTPEQLDELEELDCYDDCGHEGRRAKSMAHRYDAVESFVRVTDTDDCFEVSIDYIGVEGDAVTNDIVEDFADTFHMGFIGTFDPMAEDHDEPLVCVRPW